MARRQQTSRFTRCDHDRNREDNTGAGYWAHIPDKSGPGVTPAIAANTRYRVNALGAAANLILPTRKTTVGVKYFKVFSNSATVPGSSFQISAAITF